MTLKTYTADGREKNKGQSYAPQGVVFSAYASVGGSYTFSATPKLALDTVEFDPFGWYDRTLYRFQPKVPGYYRVHWDIFQGAWFNANDGFQSLLYKNGALYKSGDLRQDVVVSDNNAEHRMSSGGAAVVYLNGSTDYLEMFAWSNYTGAGRTVRPGAAYTRWDAELVASSVGVAPEPWHTVGAAGEPAFLNGWANAASGANPLRFMKDPHGFVHIAGMLTAAANVDVFVLPPGYRPDVQYAQIPLTYWNGSAVVASLAQIRGSLATQGAFRLYSSASGTPAAGNEFYVDGITFRAG